MRGIITTYVLVFGAIFLVLLGGLYGFILLQLRQANQKVAWNEALHIAEAGANYYRWCLNNKVENQCQLEKEYQDPAGNPIGKFSLQIDATQNCGIIGSTKITPSGWTYKFPEVERKISVLYGQESVAKYSYVLNSNVWVGADHEIRGLFHSNGGIRMDGENQSLVTSAAPDGEWICTGSFGCCGWVYFGKPYYTYGWDCSQNYCPSACTVNPTGIKLVGTTPVKDECVCPGVFTTTKNSNPDLFSFPVTPFNFTGITETLALMKKLTEQEGQGLYFGPSGAKGYRIVINEDNIKVWKVLSVNMLDKICTIVGSKIICDGGQCEIECPQCEGDKCVVRDPAIKTESDGPIYDGPIPQNCGLVFFEDDLWVGRVDAESKIKGKITIVSANLIDPNKETNVWLQGNIEYLRGSDLDGLTIIAQHNNLIGLYSPNQMELRGIFIAQTGFFGRNHYPCDKYSPYCLREKLEIYGAIVSKGRVGTQWISGSQTVSGYLKRESYFDSNLVYNPPPFTPRTTSDFKLVNWEELK